MKLKHEEGKELIQSIIVNGESVYELLFLDKFYPVNAVWLIWVTTQQKREIVKMIISPWM